MDLEKELEELSDNSAKNLNNADKDSLDDWENELN